MIQGLYDLPAYGLAAPIGPLHSFFRQPYDGYGPGCTLFVPKLSLLDGPGAPCGIPLALSIIPTEIQVLVADCSAMHLVITQPDAQPGTVR